MTNARNIGPLRIRAEVINGKPTGKWVLDIPSSLTSTGRRKRKRCKDRRTAETIARALKLKLELRQLGFVERAPAAGLPYADAVRRWTAALEREVQMLNLRPSSLSTIRTRLKPTLAFFGSVDVAAITPDDLRRYQHHRVTHGRKPVTVNGEVRVLRQLLGWLHRDGKLAAVPQVRRIREPQRRWPVPTQADVARLVAELPARQRVLVWLMAETGLRPGEALNLPWAHVDPERGCIEVAPFGRWQPKTGASIRRVPVRAALMGAIQALPRDSDYVSPGRARGRPRQNTRTPPAGAARRAGLARNGVAMRFTPKLFRKACATWLADRGVYPRLLQDLLGHAPGSKVTDVHYVQTSDAAWRSVAITLPVATPPGARLMREPLAISGNGRARAHGGASRGCRLSASNSGKRGLERVKGIEPSS